MNDNDSDDDNKQLKAAKEIISRYREHYKHISPDVLFNLSAIKDVSTNKMSDLDAAADQIRSHLGNVESGETLRQERWKGNVICPFCTSVNIKRLSIEEQTSKENYKYLCLKCQNTFNDDTDTKIEGSVPPLHSWMFCWYLLGCTNSVPYIAAKLGLSITAVEMMIHHMQKIFNTNEPMKHFMSFDEWSLKVGKSYKTALKEALAKQTERFLGFSVGQEVDTAEVRRHKNKSKLTPK